jgi:CRP/FNR family transcriptional regulator, cyclic AMP receptor protein
LKPSHPASRPSFRKLLEGFPLFVGINEPAMSVLERSGSRRRLEKGSFIFFRDDPSDNFYILLSGEVSIVLSSPDGRELIINAVRPGEFFGELGLLTGEPRSANAVVRQACDLVDIPGQEFLAALDCDPRITRRMLVDTASRLSRTSDFQNQLAFLDAHSRLASVLLDLDHKDEERGYITISQEELAQRTGLIRQTVAKTLGLWRRNGWLLTGRGHIMLLNRNALRLWLKEKAG